MSQTRELHILRGGGRVARKGWRKGRVPRRHNDFMIVFVFSLYLVPLPRFDDHQRSFTTTDDRGDDDGRERARRDALLHLNIMQVLN